MTVTGTATLKAGNTISLKPGFHAANGSNFTAKIGTVSTALQRYYYIKDRLGSIRITTNETGTVVSAQDYFAFGELLREFKALERYKYTEKERDKETEYDYFGARYYDSELGRWLSADPLADSYPAWSPYSYAGNNPINAKDINGMEWVYISGYGWVWQLEEEVVVTATRNDNFTFGADNSFASTLIGIGVSTTAISTATLFGGLLGLITFIPGDTEVWKQDEKRLLMSENKKLKGQVIGYVEGPILEHLDKLSGKIPGQDPNDPWNKKTWKKHLKKALDNVSKKLKKLNKTFEQVLKEKNWNQQNIQNLVNRIIEQGFKIPGR